ncbi:DUF3810 domain-containing protein [Flavobacterium sp. '19STA2R22 D10 B1']|uniref:DUF3810 domain-containing protein n=1 Tax=Flavobacterium aerium TaxID=3037261 RepID=UPI00278C0490|nr:DUF3810 domain-containing protein [Flavobacterium sp. '19STA2R22 D10 B1']
MKNKKVLLSLFLLVQLLVLKTLSYFPAFVEHYYSNGIYPYLSKFLRFTFGKIPFSFGDILYTIVILAVIHWFWKTRKNWKSNLKNQILSVTSFISVGYFLFYFLWAINYNRVPLYEKMNLNKDYSEAELLSFTEKLISKTNSIQVSITSDTTQKVVIPYHPQQIFGKTLNGYNHLADQYDFFTYTPSSIKASLFSTPLSYMGFSGYLNPFTNEAQVNDKIPLYQFPLTTCHEMAHQIGYASESEANFIGFLASVKNEDIYFQYSGYINALKYCLNIYKEYSPATFEKLIQKINPGILKNIEESHLFWLRYNTPIEDFFKVFYDNYLKLNQQKEGLETYAKFIGLLVNYYRNQPL